MPGQSDMSFCPLGDWAVMAVDRACPVDGRSAIRPEAIGRWTCTLLGTSAHGVATNMGHPGQLGHKGQCSHVFFSFLFFLSDGQSVVGYQVTTGHWLMDLYSLGYKYPVSCHKYGSYHGQQGHKGQCSHVFFFFRLMKHTSRDFFLLDMTLSGRVSSSLFCKFPDGIRPAATRGASRFPGTMRTINTFYMIILMRFYMTTITVMNSHEMSEE